MASEVKQRLLEFLRYKRISQVEFTRMLGVSSTYIGAMRRSVSDDKMLKIRQLFPDLNPDWLLYGEGEMIQGVDHNKELKRKLEEKGFAVVPVIPTEACAGSLKEFSEGVFPEDCDTIVTQIRNAEMAIRVSGDSMEPNIPDGSMLFLRRITNRTFIPWGHPLVIDTEEGVVVKCLYPVEENTDMVEARSYNTKYPPFEIPGESIYGLYRILGMLSIYSTL